MTAQSDSDPVVTPPKVERATAPRSKSESSLRQEDVRDAATYVRYAFERKGQSCALRNIPAEGGFAGVLTPEIEKQVDELSRADKSGGVAAQVLLAGWQHKGKSKAWPWFKNLFRRCVRACPALDGLDALMVEGAVRQESVEAVLQAACRLTIEAEPASRRTIVVNRVAAVTVWLVAAGNAPLRQVIECLSTIYWEPFSDKTVGDHEILRAILEVGPKAGHVSSTFRALADEARREASAARERAASEEAAKNAALASQQTEFAKAEAARERMLELEAKGAALEQQMNAARDQFEDHVRAMGATFSRATSEWLEMLATGLSAYNKDSAREEFVAILADHVRRVEVRMATYLEKLRSGKD
jgi:hypothetical protein